MAHRTAPLITEEASLRTLEKGLTAPEELATVGRAGASAAELSRRLGLHRMTLHRFLSKLMRRGYLELVEGTDHHRIGVKALELASSTMEGLPLRDIGAPLVEELNWQTRETVRTVVLDQGEVVTVDRLEIDHPITLRTQIGARRPAYCSTTGKAMLAFLSEAVVDAILARGMPRRTIRTITTPLGYKRQLQEVRRCGYSVEDEEFMDGIRCVAAPVFDLIGRVAGAISPSAPTMRVDLPTLEPMAVSVVEDARFLSHQLGYRTSPTGAVDSSRL
jgi:IclR family KDG regulon transcriptional repressor